jgi:tetratricopeptide (TPR) repeat protein
LVAAHAYRAEDPRRSSTLKAAARDVERLAGYRGNPIALLGRCYYYLVRRDDDALLDAVRQARSNGGLHPFAASLEVNVLYSRKQFDEALKLLQMDKSGPRSDDWVLLDQALVLTAMQGRKAEAERAYYDAMRSFKGGASLGFALASQQLFGPAYREKARQAAREIYERSSHSIPNARDRWYHHLMAFHADLMGPDEMLEKAGASRFNQCEAYFQIGLRRLAEGRRTEARAWFTRSLDTGIFFSGEYWLSRAFLALVDDPEWLPWIPANK